MQHLELNSVQLMDIESTIDPSRHLRVAFPHSSATGHSSLATVYFEVEPGDHIGRHTDSAEELLLVLEGVGEATVGDETGVASAGGIVTVPSMAPHDMRNVGDGPLRVLGFFSASTVVSTFDEPTEPGGPQVFVIGAPMPVLLPLEEPALV